MTGRNWFLAVLLAAVVGLSAIVTVSILAATSVRSPFRRVALRVGPAVVNIATDRVVRVAQPSGDEDTDSLSRPLETPVRRQHALGTGFIFDPRGYVLTNYHVISGYDQIMIRLADGTEFNRDSVRKIGVDPWSDLAVLKIETRRRLPVAKLGDSDRLEIGDWVAAVGNPFGLSGTLTSGVVSAFNRSGILRPRGPQFQDFIQTDASINPGNSGGPLVNEQGEVVGVNSGLRSPIHGSVGIGFAIPINFARAVADILIREGRVTRGYLGIDTQPIDELIQAALNLRTTNGVLVSAVMSNGPGARAGVLPGDVILQFGDEPVTDVQQFQILAAEAEPGRTVELVLARWGRLVRARIVVGLRADTEPRPPATPVTTRFWLGLNVRDATQSELARAGVAAGVTASEIEGGGPADNAQLKLGDIITEISGNPVTDAQSFRRLAQVLSKTRRPLLFRIVRNRQPVYVAVGPGPGP